MPRAKTIAAADVDPRWAAVASRDAAADGAFVYSVRTTGVYCRPSCPSRVAKPENVRFHANCEAAEQAGFRPCLRCRPNEPRSDAQAAATVAVLCRYIEDAEASPTLDRLARRVGMSPGHLHRLFKATTGVTPKAYARAQRAKKVQAGLARPETSVTAALYDAGFGSSGRFYEASDGMLGMTPSAYRAGGEGAAIRFAVGECSLGSILVAATDRGVCAILLGDEPDALVQDLQRRFPKAELTGGDREFDALVALVVGLVEAPGTGLDLPLDIRGTAFQQQVWAALRRIPFGATATYAEVATAIGAPQAVRAVAGACGANPLAVAIPCHRVVRTGGGLSGYRWGVERKRALLDRERQG
jgi:AraC family transcriptional regulator of adaptative response/methylated-DNA-[protein]-cysteine methyltransferase